MRQAQFTQKYNVASVYCLRVFSHRISDYNRLQFLCFGALSRAACVRYSSVTWLRLDGIQLWLLGMLTPILRIKKGVSICLMALKEISSAQKGRI